MTIRTLVLIILAVTCGIAAAIGMNQLRTGDFKVTSSNTVPVVVASRALPRGVTLKEPELVVREFPANSVPDGAISSIADAIDCNLLFAVVKDEPVLRSKLSNKEAGRGMAARIEKGYRAFTIQIPNASVVGGGFILPGNRVDILLTTTSNNAADGTGGAVTTTLLQNVEVLAVAQQDDMPKDNKIDTTKAATVTLLVKPDQAAKLNLGMNKGTLHLTLRNPEDVAEGETHPATMEDLRFHQEGPMVAPAPAEKKEPLVAEAPAPPQSPVKYSQINTLRGNQRGVVNIVVER